MKAKAFNNRTAWSIGSNTVMILFSVLALAPFVLLLIASFTDNEWATANGFTFFPVKWSLDAYAYIATSWITIGRAYLMTIIVTLIGTVGAILITTLLAYALSHSHLPGIKLLNFLTIFTMLFSGGIVASFYIWVNVFHIRDTVWALILPNLFMNAFNIILVKNYFITSVPASLTEAARIDGAGEFRIFWKIVFPLSKPIIATIGLMTAINYWNDWTNGLYYLTQRGGGKLYTIQLVLNQINENINFLATNSEAIRTTMTLPSTTARMAIAVIGMLPVIVVYPFFQKFFAKGITLGAVKG